MRGKKRGQEGKGSANNSRKQDEKESNPRGDRSKGKGGGISEGEKESNKVHQVPAKGGWLR